MLEDELLIQLETSTIVNNFISVLQLLEFMSFLILTNLMFRRFEKPIDIPFLGFFTSSVLYMVPFVFLPANTLVWSAVVLATYVGVFFSFKDWWKNQKSVDSIHKISLTIIGWIVAFLVTATFCTSMLLFPPSNRQKNSEPIGRSAKLMSQLFAGEDNFAHVNMMKVLHDTGRSTYFYSTKVEHKTLFKGSSSYPQLPNAIASNFQTAIDVAAHFVSPNSTKSDRLLLAYIVAHFVLVGFLIGIAVCVVLSILRRFAKINDYLLVIIAAIGTIFALNRLTFPIINYGFFSQSAGTAALLMLLLIEVDPTFNSLKKNQRILVALLRAVPLVLVGHTWWYLAPLAFTVIGIRFLGELITDFKNRSLRKNIWPTIILAVAGAFSMLPAFILIFLYKTDAGDTLKAGGAIEPIDIPSILKYLIAATLLFLALHFALAKKNRVVTQNLVVFSFFGYLSLKLVSRYQLSATKAYSYYGYKLAWSVAWVPFIAGLLFVSLICVFVVSIYRKNLKEKINIPTAFLTPLLIAVIFFMLSNVVAKESTSLGSLWNQRQLSDFNLALNTANEKGKQLIVVSDCSPIFNYFHQKAAISLQTNHTKEMNKYSLLVLTDSVSASKYASKLLKENPRKYMYVDLTPLSDNNSPSDRFEGKGYEGLRTGLEDIWSTETLNSQCNSESVNAIP